MALKDRKRPGLRSGDLDEEDSRVARFRRQLLEQVDLEALSRLDTEQLRARLERVAGNLLTREGPVISQEQRTNLIRQVVDEMLGLGVLEPLLADETVTEIMVNGPDDVWVERAGRLERDDSLRFASEAQLYQTIDRIVSAVNRRIDESEPMVDARLASGERVNIVIPPLSLNGPCLTIRRFPSVYTMGQLILKESLDETLAMLLRAFVEARFNIVVSGGTGTGKTTFLNALSGYIPRDERIITVEDAAELQLQQPHVIGLEARPPNVEGKGRVTIRDLVRNSLRMRPDRILVGEVRGGETLDMLQAMNTGHEGSLTTVHANSPRDAILRLETLASMTDLSITFDALRDQINTSVEVLVHLDRDVGGHRRVEEVALLVSGHRELFRLTTIYEHEPGPDPDHPGRYVHHGLPAAVRDRLHRARVEVPRAYDRDLDADTRTREIDEAGHAR